MSKTVLRMPVLFRYDRKNEPSLNRLWQWLEEDKEFKARSCDDQLAAFNALDSASDTIREKLVLVHTEYDAQQHEEMLDAVIETFEHIATFVKEKKLLKMRETAQKKEETNRLEALISYPDTNEMQKPMTRLLHLTMNEAGAMKINRIEYHTQLQRGSHGNRNQA